MIPTVALVAFSLLAAFLILHFVFPKYFVAMLLHAVRRIAGLRTRSIDVDGIAWPYLEGGPDSGETVILLHGFGADKDNWPFHARFLRREYRVIIPDLPGFGENAKDPGVDYRGAAQADRLHRFVRAMGIDKFHIAGNSMGGFVALKYTLAHSSRIITLALLNSAGVTSVNKSEVEQAAACDENLLVVSSPDDFDALMDIVTYKPIPLPGVIRRAIYEKAIDQKSFLDPIFWSLIEDTQTHPLDDRLHEITAPTLIIWGRHDRVIDVSCTELMKAEIPNNRCVVFEDAGHMPMLECPARSGSAHRDFLNQHRAAEPALQHA